VCRAATESICELGRRRPLIPPTQQPTLERSQPVRLFRTTAAGKLREVEHPLDVLAAALEAATDLAGADTRGREPPNSTFEGPEVPEIIHDSYRTPRRAKCPSRTDHGRFGRVPSAQLLVPLAAAIAHGLDD
jgi:hypothetical protein